MPSDITDDLLEASPETSGEEPVEDFDELQLNEASVPPEERYRRPTMNVPLKGRIESVLFLTGKALQIAEIAELVEAEPDDVEEALMDLINDYAFRDGSALEIDDTDGYILQIKEDYQAVVDKMVPVDISAAAIRTLSAIALKAPILQSDLIELRGSNAYDHIHELYQKKMISKKRKGRSYVLNVTPKFYQYFKLTGDKKELALMMRGQI